RRLQHCVRHSAAAPAARRVQSRRSLAQHLDRADHVDRQLDQRGRISRGARRQRCGALDHAREHEPGHYVDAGWQQHAEPGAGLLPRRGVQQVRRCPPSNTACTAFPFAPTNLVAKAVDGQTIDLTWTDNSAFEDGYEVQRCCQTGSIVVANLPANAVSYRDAGLVANTRYYYTVRAKK